MPVVPATWETKVRGSQLDINLDKDKHENLSKKQIKQVKGLGCGLHGKILAHSSQQYTVFYKIDHILVYKSQ
jgi:hypothetical protein